MPLPSDFRDHWRAAIDFIKSLGDIDSEHYKSDKIRFARVAREGDVLLKMCPQLSGLDDQEDVVHHSH